MDNKRNYPVQLFVIGVALNMVRTFYVGAFILLLLVVGIFAKSLIKISGIIFCIWVIYAVFNQFFLSKTALQKSSNEQYNNIMDSLLGEKGPFSKSEDKSDLNTVLDDIVKNGTIVNDEDR